MDTTRKTRCRRTATTLAGSVALALAATTFTAIPSHAADTQAAGTSTVTALTSGAALPSKALTASAKADGGKTLKEQQGRATTVTSLDFFDVNESRTKGHGVLTSKGLTVWTEDNSSLAKSARYHQLDQPIPLPQIGEPSITFADGATGVRPSLQLGISLDGDRKVDGYLVNEGAVYGEGNWWTNRDGFGVASGMGYASFGTLAEFQAANPDAQVVSVGYSLGSGVKGYATITSLAFAGQTYVLAAPTAKGGTATEASANGWTVPADARFVAGGVQLTSPGEWKSTSLQRSYDGYLASLADADFDASPSQYVGIHVQTSKGTLVYEQEASYQGKWWSKADLGVGGGMGYASFATLGEYVAANPDLKVQSVRVLYTSPTQSTATIGSVTFGGARYDFSARSASVVTAKATSGVHGTAGSVDVTVSAVAGPATGTVTVAKGSTKLGTATLHNGTAKVAIPAGKLAVGSHTLTVSYGGSGAVAPASTTAKVTVAKSAATMSAKWSSAKYGTPAKVDVTVKGAAGAATGKVEVREGSKVLATKTLSKGKATVTLPKSLKVGKHSLSLRYLGSSTVESKSASKTLNVAKATTKAKLKLSASKVKPNQRAKATVTVTAPNLKPGGKATIVITSKSGKVVNVKTTVKNGKVTKTLPRLLAGSYKVSVKYAATSTAKAATSAASSLSVKW